MYISIQQNRGTFQCAFFKNVNLNIHFFHKKQVLIIPIKRNKTKAFSIDTLLL